MSNQEGSLASLIRTREVGEERLKSLAMRIDRLKLERKAVEIEVANMERNIDSYRSEDLVVTDHAVIRYMERVMGLEVERVRDEIADLAREQHVEVLESGRLPGPEDSWIVVRHKRVITVTPRQRQP